MPQKYRIVAIPILEENFGINQNSDTEGTAMAKFDPKLVKKISHSKLIACSTEVGIKNAEKVSKEVLIPAYLDAVEKAENEGGELSTNVVTMYNEVVMTLGLDKEEEAPVTGEETDAAPPAPAPAPTKITRPSPPKAKPAPTDAGKPGEAKTSEKRAAKPRKYTRIDAMADALASMKGGGKLDALYAKASKLYIDKGGSDKLIEATFFANVGLTAIKAMGFIEITDTEFKVVK
jgi:hypothetical protein